MPMRAGHSATNRRHVARHALIPPSGWSRQWCPLVQTSRVFASRLRLIGCVFAVASLTGGCISVQVASADGRAKLIGVGSARTIQCQNGEIYQLTAPGCSIRFHSAAPGLSFGWQRTRLFFPGPGSDSGPTNLPVAIQRELVGLNLSPSQIMLGIDNTFAVPRPADGSNIIQSISFTATNPT